MRKASFLALFILAVAVPAFAQDPVKVDSKHYKVESQNSRVRVLRIHYGAREKSVMHYHPAAVATAITDCHIKFNLPGGKSEERTMKAGETMLLPAGKHLPENFSDSDFEVVPVELKTPKHKPAANPAVAPPPPRKQ